MNDNRSQSRIEIVNAMERATATWEIRDLVVSVGHWDSAKEVLILPIQVERPIGTRPNGN
jgi:hypothetical protein